MEKALGAGLASAADVLAVWTRFIEYLVRKCRWDDETQVSELREAFTRATDHLIQSKNRKKKKKTLDKIGKKKNFHLIISFFLNLFLADRLRR